MSGAMRAIVKNRAEAGATLEERPIPTCGSDEVLIRVKYVSLCGTDFHIYKWDKWAAGRVKPPLIVGHELSGEIVQVGERVSGWSPGDLVAVETRIVCGHCKACRLGRSNLCATHKIIGVDRDGGFAEYIAMPAVNLWRVDPTIPLHTASIMEPLGNAVHAVLAGDVVAKTVAVVGCGPLGLLGILVAKAVGAHKVIAMDVNEYRLNLAKEIGADVVIASNQEDPVAVAKSLTDGLGADVVLEMSGNEQAIRQSFAMLAAGGHISMLGVADTTVELDITDGIVFKGATIYGITGRLMYKTWEQTSNLLSSGQLDLTSVITHQLPFEKFEEGFALMQSGQCGKIVLSL